jgi:hypothetical protein
VTVSRHPTPHSPARGERDKLPVSEQARLVQVDLLQPGYRFGVLASEPFEFVHGPPGEVLVDAPCEEAQLGAVEGSVIVDPASYLGADLVSEAGQVRAAAAVEVPGPDLTAFRLPRLVADGRGEASEIASAAAGNTAPEGVAEEGRSWCARSCLGGSRLCSTRSSSSRGAAQGQGPRACQRWRPAAPGPVPRCRSAQRCRLLMPRPGLCRPGWREAWSAGRRRVHGRHNPVGAGGG